MSGADIAIRRAERDTPPAASSRVDRLLGVATERLPVKIFMMTTKPVCLFSGGRRLCAPARSAPARSEGTVNCDREGCQGRETGPRAYAGGLACAVKRLPVTKTATGIDCSSVQGLCQSAVRINSVPGKEGGGSLCHIAGAI